MKKELEKVPQRIVVYDVNKDGDWLLEASFPPGFKIVKVIGEERKRIARGNASDKPVG